MQTLSLVYLIRNIKTDKAYVGKTDRSLDKRMAEHFMDAKTRPEKSVLHKSIRKYGKRKFFIQPLTSFVSPEQATNLEKIWIVLLRSCNKKYGYNLSYGGEGHEQSQETKDKLINLRGNEHPNYKDEIDIERILELRNQGLGKHKISEMTGYPVTTVSRRLKELKVPALPKPLEHVSEERVISLYQTGMSTRQVAGFFHISKTSVSNILKRHGVELRPAHRPKGS